MSDNPFHAPTWSPLDGFTDLTDITYHRHITQPTVRVTRLAFMTDEAVEGRDAFLEKRAPDWTPFPRHF